AWDQGDPAGARTPRGRRSRVQRFGDAAKRAKRPPRIVMPLSLISLSFRERVAREARRGRVSRIFRKILDDSTNPHPACGASPSPGGRRNLRWTERQTSWLVTIAALALCASCNSKPPDAAERGRIVYVTNCVVCHNPNPNLPGTQGPPIAGSSEALLEARVLNLSYPP